MKDSIALLILKQNPMLQLKSKEEFVLWTL